MTYNITYKIKHPIYLNGINPNPLITFEMVEKNKNDFPFKRPDRGIAIFSIVKFKYPRQLIIEDNIDEY